LAVGGDGTIHEVGRYSFVPEPPRSLPRQF
jgi:diacylglycerol kinase family enzyme